MLDLWRRNCYNSYVAKSLFGKRRIRAKRLVRYLKTVGLNKQWMCGKDEISLPFDILCDRQRNLAAPFGAYNSYYEAACVRLTRRVPVKNYYRAYLETSGVAGKADVYADGAYLGSVTHDGRSLLPCPQRRRRFLTISRRSIPAGTPVAALPTARAFCMPTHRCSSPRTGFASALREAAGKSGARRVRRSRQRVGC